MSYLIRRCLARPAFHAVPLSSSRAAIPRANLLRTYASTTKGDTDSASSLATPSPKPSDSPQEGDVKSSRATERESSELGGSVSQPVSDPGQASAAHDEEGGDPVKQDPNKPKEQKKEETLKQGDTPLDPADK